MNYVHVLTLSIFLVFPFWLRSKNNLLWNIYPLG